MEEELIAIIRADPAMFAVAKALVIEQLQTAADPGTEDQTKK